MNFNIIIIDFKSYFKKNICNNIKKMIKFENIDENFVFSKFKINVFSQISRDNYISINSDKSF